MLAECMGRSGDHTTMHVHLHIPLHANLGVAGLVCTACQSEYTTLHVTSFHFLAEMFTQAWVAHMALPKLGADAAAATLQSHGRSSRGC